MAADSQVFDAAVIGGGVIGCSTALHLARGGMKVALIERGGICREASGRNAGTLTLTYTRAQLVPFAEGGRTMWMNAAEWLGQSVDYHPVSSLEVAVTDKSAEEMAAEMRKRDPEGRKIRMVDSAEARRIAPEISPNVVAAAYSESDGFANSNIVGLIFRKALIDAGVDLRPGVPLHAAARDGEAWRLECGPHGAIAARKVIIAAGTWIGKVASHFGVHLPMIARVNQGTITERGDRLLSTMLRYFGKISIKQFPNGTILIGGSPQQYWLEDPNDTPDPGRILQRMLAAVQAAAEIAPVLREVRVVRTWVGLEGFAADNMPVIGPLDAPNLYAAGGARSGFTAGPCIGKAVADTLLGKQPELEAFQAAFAPARLAALPLPDIATMRDQAA